MLLRGRSARAARRALAAGQRVPVRHPRSSNVTRTRATATSKAAVARCARRSANGSSGTRLGGCLHEFNSTWSRRGPGAARGAVVLLVTTASIARTRFGIAAEGRARCGGRPPADSGSTAAALRRLRAPGLAGVSARCCPTSTSIARSTDIDSWRRSPIRSPAIPAGAARLSCPRGRAAAESQQRRIIRAMRIRGKRWPRRERLAVISGRRRG